MLNSVIKSLEGEIWKPVAVSGYECLYEVSNFGRVSSRRCQIMTPAIQNSGYKMLMFKCKGLQPKNVLVHRLVASAFLENPENKPEVAHIDHDKLNNHVSNLMWVTSSENKQQSIASGIWEYNTPTLGIKKFGSSSKYYGVVWDKTKKQWRAGWTVNKKLVGAKGFNDELEAAKYANEINLKLGLNRPLNKIDN